MKDTKIYNRFLLGFGYALWFNLLTYVYVLKEEQNSINTAVSYYSFLIFSSLFFAFLIFLFNKIRGNNKLLNLDNNLKELIGQNRLENNVEDIRCYLLFIFIAIIGVEYFKTVDILSSWFFPFSVILFILISLWVLITEVYSSIIFSSFIIEKNAITESFKSFNFRNAYNYLFFISFFGSILLNGSLIISLQKAIPLYWFWSLLTFYILLLVLFFYSIYKLKTYELFFLGKCYDDTTRYLPNKSENDLYRSLAEKCKVSLSNIAIKTAILTIPILIASATTLSVTLPILKNLSFVSFMNILIIFLLFAFFVILLIYKVFEKYTKKI